MRVLLATLLAAVFTAAASSQTAPQAQSLDRVGLVEVWLEAVDRHTPGLADESARAVGAWSARELALLREHLPTVISLIRQPDLAIFFRRTPGTTRTRQVTYSGNELDSLRVLARRHGRVRPADLCPDDDLRRYPAFNSATHLLKRAAMFHLDLLAGDAADVPSERRDDRFSFTMRVNDGQSLGQFAVAGHVELARQALEHVSQPCASQPAPAKDAWVRDWYAASLAYQLSEEQFEVAHVVRAIELFRDDAEVLTMGGAIHEALAGPGFQAALGLDRDLRDRLGVQTASGELGGSEGLLRRALQRDGQQVEARIRLGRVLGLRGKHVEAARELERTVSGAGEDRLLAYYARLLHGRELEATGNRVGARLAYEHAARLYPTAHAPRLALSQMLRATGDAVAAVNMLGRLVEPSNDAPDDPWWRYHITAGRSLERRMHALWASTPAPVRP